MNRLLLQEMVKWKDSKKRKPLILAGARQVGKTWLMKELGRQNFKQTAYFNFESSERMRKLFATDFDINRIITVLETEMNQKIDVANTLIIFDEIQEAERALTVLKYFYEQAPQYFVVAAGSLLGISLQKDNSFPVGKVDMIKMYPLSFLEFLHALGEERLAQQVQLKEWKVISVFHEKLIELLRLYYFIGGMPEAVADYIENKDLASIRSIQQKILMGYENDFAKHAPHGIVPRIRLVWNHLIGQLAKENKKFIYGQVKKGARAKEFDLAINWLMSAGLVIKVSNVDKPDIPLHAYANLDFFKLFFVDIGLLNAHALVDQKIILEKNNILTGFKGALTEQYVCQQLYAKTQLFYWSAERATAEVDFLVQNKNEIVPIEVKAEENLKSKSLKVFAEKYKIKNSVRTSMKEYREESWMTNIPLYAIDTVIG
ncbi:MAG: ATP-binding protein [Bacteroidetes bacterium]|nr:ATP-binding protein [Bacteroidota bacterium]MBS1539145.1 ATP-binding protein [Bacteroidota bacterium]